MSGKDYMDVSGFAKKWNVKPSTVRKWIYDDKLPQACQDELYHPWRIPKDEIPLQKILKKS